MPIGSPSGSGATQNDIADGADESNGRWFTIYDGHTVATQPDPVTVSTVGGSVDFTSAATFINATSSGDSATIYAGLGSPSAAYGLNSGAILCRTMYVSQAGIGSLTNQHLMGFPNDSQPEPSDNNIAVFNPSAGDSTSGNVRVDNGGTTTDGTVTYPDLTEFHSYCVLIDFEGYYLNAGETGFYIDSDPRLGGSPNETIAAVPDFGAFNTAPGVGQTSTGGSDGLQTLALEVSHRP